MYIRDGNNVQVLGSLSVLAMATLLQTKELDESMPDALGILPEHKKQKKLFLDQELLDCSEQHPEGQSNARPWVCDIAFFIFFVGIFASSWMGATVFWLGEWFIKRMPFMKHIYSASKQISAAISPD